MPINVSVDRNALMRAAAERIVAVASAAIKARRRFDWALSGGSTPKQLYSLLGTAQFATRIDWQRVHLFWGDERCVPPDHPDSNYRMVRESLLTAISIPEVNVHRMLAELSPAHAATEYERDLAQHFKQTPGTTPPQFDLMLLGMGPDGHTASLFPGTPALQEKARWVVPNRVDKLDSWRLSLTFPVINAARQVSFLVSGADKAAPLSQVLAQGPASALPAALVQPTAGEVEWLIDQPAAAAIPTRPKP
jgi:6-phosphogluconolactonase